MNITYSSFIVVTRMLFIVLDGSPAWIDKINVLGKNEVRTGCALQYGEN